MQHWFESYLSNRKQYVSIKNCSPLSQTLHWVFHNDRCLGPVLLLLYINDMYRSSNQMSFILFSDDTTVFASDSDINNVHATVNRELVGVDNWVKAKVKVKSSMARSLPVENLCTTTECGFNYQLLAVIY